MKQITKLMICGTALVALGGCQSFFSKFGLAPSRVADTESEFAGVQTQRLNLGLAALRTGNPGNAIHHLERAILEPESAPEAYNGMGVAYAQLGREDLAKRFFDVAIMLKPSDTRFARNLARLDQSAIGQSARALATRDAETAGILAEAASAAEAQGLLPSEAGELERRGNVVIDTRTTSLERTSSNEIRVSSQAERFTQPANVEVASRRPAVIKEEDVSILDGPIAANFDFEEFCTVDRVQVVSDTSGRDRRASVPVTSSAASYPVRVSLLND
ncbi:MAG: hypothetical protein ABJP48_10540 [Erythrobacter sp.]